MSADYGQLDLINTRLIPVKSLGKSGSTGYKPVGTIRKVPQKKTGPEPNSEGNT